MDMESSRDNSSSSSGEGGKRKKGKDKKSKKEKKDKAHKVKKSKRSKSEKKQKSRDREKGPVQLSKVRELASMQWCNYIHADWTSLKPGGILAACWHVRQRLTSSRAQKHLQYFMTALI